MGTSLPDHEIRARFTACEHPQRLRVYSTFLKWSGGALRQLERDLTRLLACTFILQNIRLSSDGANQLNGSRNSRADGDGCVGFRLQGPRRRAQGCNGFHGQRLIPKSRCAAFFVSPVSPDFEIRIGTAAWVPGHAD